MTLVGPRNIREFFTSEPGSVLLLTFVMIVVACLIICLMTPSSSEEEKITLTKTQLDEIKADAYTAGHIDGRASAINEDMDHYCPLGVPEGYEPSPWTEWRKYATIISNTSNHARCTP